MEKTRKAIGFKEVWASIHELTQRQKETDRQQKETDRQIKETAKRQNETDRQIKETAKQLRETDRYLKEKFSDLKEYVGGLGRNIGDAAESYFYETLANSMKIGNLDFDFIDKNVKRKNRRQNIEGEYDIILTNTESIAIIEIKHKFHPNDIDKLLNKKLPAFKKLFPDKKDYKIYFVVAGFSVPDDTKELAFKNGFFVMTQGGGKINLEHVDIKAY